jgi:O-antigen/teichoic acid export membrane protein
MRRLTAATISLRRPGVGVNARFALLTTAASALGLAKSLVLATILGVDDFGLYGLVLIVIQFGLLAASLGVLDATNVRLPTAVGRGDRDVGEQAGRALASIVTVSILVAILYMGSVAVTASGKTRLVLLLATASVLVATTSEFYMSIARARQEFPRVGAMSFARASIAIVLGPVGGALFGVKGAMIAEILGSGVLLVLWAVSYRGFVRLGRPALREALGLMRIGLPLMGSSLVLTAAFTIDRLMVAATVPDVLGQYVFASIVVSLAIVAFGMLRQTIYPQMLFERGRGVTLDEIRRKLLRLCALLAVVGAGGLPVLILLTNVLGRPLFGQYRLGLNLMPVFYIGGVLSLLTVYEVLLLVRERYYLALVGNGVGAVIVLIGGLGLVLSDSASATAYAWLFVLGQAASTGTIFLVAERVHHDQHDGGASEAN